MVEAEEEATGRDRGQTEDREEHESLRSLLMTRNRSHARFHARAHSRKRAFSHTHFSLPLTRTQSPLLSLACTNTIFAFFLCLSSGPTAFLLACITHFPACLCFSR